MRVGLEAFLMLAAVLFSLGLYGALSKKATVQVLMSLELMAIAVNINLVALSRFVDTAHDGRAVLRGLHDGRLRGRDRSRPRARARDLQAHHVKRSHRPSTS